MSKGKVVIVDYGLGNLFNVKRTFDWLGASAIVSGSKEDLLSADRLVLPGVGAFAEGMKGLKERDLVGAIRDFAGSGRPVLGICLGAQLMLTHSEEHGLHDGLDLIKGIVVRLRTPEKDGEIYKIPQIGWNSLQLPDYASNDLWDGTVLRGLGREPFMYFLHSYIITLTEHKHAIAFTEYGHDRFCSVYQTKNIAGFQAHPERSGETGLKVYRNFLEHSG